MILPGSSAAVTEVAGVTISPALRVVTSHGAGGVTGRTANASPTVTAVTAVETHTLTAVTHLR